MWKGRGLGECEVIVDPPFEVIFSMYLACLRIEGTHDDPENF